MHRIQPNRYNCWGLYEKDSSVAIPLSFLDISIKIVSNIAKISYSQTYINNSHYDLETEFFFPISPDACFDSFEVTFKDTVIKGVVKSKSEARQQYYEAMQRGKTAAYSEINEETGDIMKIQIGNIPPQTDIVVTYSFIQKLETALHKFWCFRLFSTLTPRYQGGNLRNFLDHDVNLLSNYPTISQNDKKAYPWTIQAEIQSPSPIISVNSPSHSISSIYGNERHTCRITLDSQVKYFPNKDFVLLYSNGKEGDKIDYMLTPFEDGYCAMVTFMADFDKKASVKEVYENFIEGKETESTQFINTAKGEFIFLIDRSGSMSGQRIEMAKKSLILFLKSLPKDSFFNVISFGDKHVSMFNQSKKYSQKSLDQAVKEIEQFTADLGGTEIYKPLEKLFSSKPPEQGYPRFVFLLTDGDVSNTYEVLELIRNNNKASRVFTIGIGNGCSPELIKKGAAYGKGKNEFVTDNKQIYEKVISLLNASLSPCYSNLSLNIENFDAVVKSVSPDPASISCLISGESVTFFLLLNEKAFQFQKNLAFRLQMFDPNLQKYQAEITLEASKSIENEMISKLAIRDIITRLEEKTDRFSKNKFDDIIWMIKRDISQTVLDYSIKYGILGKQTAFYCEFLSAKRRHSVYPTKVIVPTILSKDYQPSDTLFAYSSGVTRGAYVGGLAHSPTLCMSLPKSARKESKSSVSGLLSVIGLLLSCLFIIISAPIKLYNLIQSYCSKRVPSTSSQQKPSSSNNKSSDKYEKFMNESNSAASTKSSHSIVQANRGKSNNSYLDVVIKQKFEGYWDPNDQQIIDAVSIEKKLALLPDEIKVKNKSFKQEVWITVLILLWLEVACQNDKNAWTLIHQKGCQWLKTQGVDYSAVKNMAASKIKSKNV